MLLFTWLNLHWLKVEDREMNSSMKGAGKEDTFSRAVRAMDIYEQNLFGTKWRWKARPAQCTSRVGLSSSSSNSTGPYALSDVAISPKSR